MPRLLPSFAAIAALGLATPAPADELSPEKLAAIQHDEEKALAKVGKAHGDRKPAEMSPEERREVMGEEQAAKHEVLEKHDVGVKEYVTRGARLSREEKAQVETAKKAIQAREEADQRAAAEKKPEEPPATAKEVIIRREWARTIRSTSPTPMNSTRCRWKATGVPATPPPRRRRRPRRRPRRRRPGRRRSTRADALDTPLPGVLSVPPGARPELWRFLARARKGGSPRASPRCESCSSSARSRPASARRSRAAAPSPRARTPPWPPSIPTSGWPSSSRTCGTRRAARAPGRAAGAPATRSSPWANWRRCRPWRRAIRWTSTWAPSPRREAWRRCWRCRWT